MKQGIAVTIIFVLYIAASFLTQGYLSQSAGEMEQKGKEIQEDIVSENWDMASEGISELSDQWESHKPRWLLLEDHDKVDEIDEAIRNAQDMIVLHETPHSTEAMGRFIFHITDVPDKGRLELANIF